MKPAVIVEGIGTALLLFLVVGSGAALFGTGDGAASELLAHGVAVAAGLGVLVAMFLTVSGSHFNPAVTLAFWRRGEIAGGAAAAFVGAQIVGAAVGVVLAHVSASLTPLSVSTLDRSGIGVVVSEAIGTFGLVFVILRLVDTDRSGWIPAAVAAWVGAIIVGTSSTGFANPAVTIGRLLSETATGIAPAWVPGFVVSQIVGAWAAVALAEWLQTKGNLS